MQKISRRTPHSLQRDEDMLLEGSGRPFLVACRPPSSRLVGTCGLVHFPRPSSLPLRGAWLSFHRAFRSLCALGPLLHFWGLYTLAKSRLGVLLVRGGRRLSILSWRALHGGLRLGGASAPPSALHALGCIDSLGGWVASVRASLWDARNGRGVGLRRGFGPPFCIAWGAEPPKQCNPPLASLCLGCIPLGCTQSPPTARPCCACGGWGQSPHPSKRCKGCVAPATSLRTPVRPIGCKERRTTVRPLGCKGGSFPKPWAKPVSLKGFKRLCRSTSCLKGLEQIAVQRAVAVCLLATLILVLFKRIPKLFGRWAKPHVN